MNKHSRVIPQGKSHYCITTSSSELPRDKRVGGAVNELLSLVESHDSTSMGWYRLHSRQQALGLSSTVAFSFLVRGNNKNKHIVNSYCARQFLSSSTSFKVPCFIKWDLGFQHNKKCLLHGLAGVFFPWLLEAHQYASVRAWVRIHIYGHDQYNLRHDNGDSYMDAVLQVTLCVAAEHVYMLYRTVEGWHYSNRQVM